MTASVSPGSAPSTKNGPVSGLSPLTFASVSPGLLDHVAEAVDRPGVDDFPGLDRRDRLGHAEDVFEVGVLRLVVDDTLCVRGCGNGEDTAGQHEKDWSAHQCLRARYNSRLAICM